MARFSDGLKKLWRALIKLPLSELFIVAYFPAWSVYSWSVTGWLWPWWMLALTVVVWLGCLVDLCRTLLRTMATVGYPGSVFINGKRYAVTNLTVSSDGSATADCVRADLWEASRHA